MEISIIVILAIWGGIVTYAAYNLLKKNEILEEKYEESQIYMNSISKIINNADEKLKELDEKGAFKGDDEIGWFFKNILYIQEILNQYNLNEKTKTKTGSKETTNYDYSSFDPKIGEEEKKTKNY